MLPQKGYFMIMNKNNKKNDIYIFVMAKCLWTGSVIMFMMPVLYPASSCFHFSICIPLECHRNKLLYYDMYTHSCALSLS